MNRMIYLFLMFLFLLSCAPEEIEIGVALPQKGEQATMAQGIIRGVQLAVDEWNIRGGALGKRIVLRIMDDEADAEKAVEVAKELVNKRVIGIIGHMNSHCSIAASEIYETAGVVMITPASTNPELTERNYKNIFRICGRDDIQAKSAGEFIINTLKAKTIYLIHDHSVYAAGLIQILKECLKNKVFIKGEKGINQGDTIFDGVIKEIKISMPDVIYFAGYDPEGARLVKQLRSANINAIFFGADGLASENFLKIAGDNAENVLFTFGPSVEDLGSAQHFARVYKEKHNILDQYAVYAYDATNILLEAYCRSKGRSISDVLHEEKFDGALGMISFNEKGDIVHAPYMVWTVKGQEFTPWVRRLE